MTLSTTARPSKFSLLLSAVFATAIVGLSQAPDFAFADEIAGREIVHRAGETTWLRESADSWRRMLLAQSAAYNNPAIADAATRQRLASAWEGAVSTAFSSEKMTADVETALSLAFKPDELSAVVAFYDTALGRRIHAAEQPAAVAPDVAKERMALIAAAHRLQSDRKRREVLSRLADAMGGVEGEIDALTIVSIGAANGMLKAIPEGSLRAESVDLDTLNSARRATLRAALEPLMLPSMERRYARFSLAELKVYASELSSPLAKRFALVVRAASNEALRRQAVSIGQAFSKRLNAQSL